MKNRITKIMMLLLFCASVLIPAVSVDAADENVSNGINACMTKEYDVEEVADYLAGDNLYPTEEGYLFAGWYTTDVIPENDTEALKYVVRDSIPSDVEKVYALFVPSSVLGVKAQLSRNLLDGLNGNRKGTIRFVTTVNSSLYQQVGFEISYVNSYGAKKSVTTSSSQVYRKLYAVGNSTEEYQENSKEYLPTEFCDASKYFRACNLTNVLKADFDLPFSVKAFWITLDGSKVYGETAIKSIDDYFLKEDVYVSTSETVADKADTEGYGSSEEKPYATLNYALSQIKNQGTVHIVENYATSEEFEWKKHNKTVNITGGELDFTTLPKKELREAQGTTTPEDASDDVAAVIANVLDINDSVSFKDISLKFANGQHVYANGNTVKVAEDVTWSNGDAYIEIYGGSHSVQLKSDTNLILGAGQYTRVFGGGNYDSPLIGNVNVTLSGSINPNIDYKYHDETQYAVFGGGQNKSSVTGNIVLDIMDESVLFQRVYGGGNYNQVYGDIKLSFAGKAFTLFGGGFKTKVTGDICLNMTGGWSEQIFGGCNHANVIGNTNVNVQGGHIERRVYGGCYNELSMWGEWEETYFVTGHTNVSISPKANVSLDYSGTDLSIYAISRGEAPFKNEWGTFIFNDTVYESYVSKLGHNDSTYDNKFSEQSYHYLIKTNGNTADGSLGTVLPMGDSIHLQPKRGYSVEVVDAETNEKFYTESEGVFKLPNLTESTDSREITVTFSEIGSDIDKTDYEARINTEYYSSLEGAVAAASQMNSQGAVTITLLRDAEVETQMNITSKIIIQNEAGKDITLYRGTGLAEHDMFNVESTGRLTLLGKDGRNSLVFDGRTKEEANANMSLADTAGSTGSLIKAEGDVSIKDVTMQYAKKTTGSGGAIYSLANLTVRRSKFNTCSTKGEGGAIYAINDCIVSISDSTFDGNESTGNRGGAICIGTARSNPIEIINCIFENNTAKTNGGAIRISAINSLNISDSTFNGNVATNEFGGAVAMGSSGSTLNLYGNCVFTNNASASNKYGGGGAIFAPVNFNIKDGAWIEMTENNCTTSIGDAICVQATESTAQFVIEEGASLFVYDNTAEENNSTDDICVTDGTTLTPTVNGSYGAWKPVARIGNVGYETLESAVALANGEEVQVIHDVILNENITLNGNLMLNAKLTIANSVTITTDGLANRTIYCGTGAVADNVIEIAGTELQVAFIGSEDSRLIFDGTEVTLSKSFISVASEEVDKVAMQYVTMQNITSTGAGAAVNSSAPLDIINCKFDACASNGSGGAIYSLANLIVQQSEFNTCSTKGEGGAIYAINDCIVSISDSTFDGNESTGNRGGAICIGTARSNPIEIINCIFENNTAKTNGGAIRISAINSLNISDSTFNGNVATKEFGGAVAMGSSGSTLNLYGNCMFTNNASASNKYGGGGAIFAPVNFNIKDGAWIEMTENNCTTSIGDAICVQATESTAQFVIEEGASLFVYDNTAEENNSTDDICVTDGTTLTPTVNGSYGAWKPVARIGNVGYETLESAVASANGEEIEVIRDVTLNEDIILNGNIVLNANLFIAKSVTISTDGVADRTIYCGSDATSNHVILPSASDLEVTFRGTSESSRLIFDGNSKNGVTLTNAFIYSGKTADNNLVKKITMQYVTMQNIDSSYNYGSAICSNAIIEAEHCKFIECESTHNNANGGAIYTALTASGTKFTNCQFEKCISGRRGGAIYSKGTMFVENSSFTNNESDNAGGAIMMDGLINLDITECTFEGNKAGHFGGAVAFSSSNGGTLNLYKKCVFRRNTSTYVSGNYNGGGAIFASQYFYIKDGALVEMSENYCTGFASGHAISVNYKATDPVIEVMEGAKLYIYDNDSTEDVDTSDDICKSDGSAFVVTGNYIASAPTAE